RHIKQSLLRAGLVRFGGDITRDAREIFSGKVANGGFFCLTNPGNLQFHGVIVNAGVRRPLIRTSDVSFRPCLKLWIVCAGELRFWLASWSWLSLLSFCRRLKPSFAP